jgi:tetratricopeptide (TPR) repeat protein
MSWLAPLQRWFERFAARRSASAPVGAGTAEQLASRAQNTLEHALSESDTESRVAQLREALAIGERLSGERGDQIVLEASLHLGERMRAAGHHDEAVLHFERAVTRSFRFPDPVGRHRRAGVLSRLGILDQEAGELLRARARYREALDLGRDSESQQLLGMLTQAAFNLGLLQSEDGEDELAVASWESALEMGLRAGNPAGWDPAAVAAFNLGHLLARRGDPERARRMFGAVVRIGEPSGTPLGRMACAKASLALAAMAEQEGLLGAPEAERQYARAVQFGRDCELPEGVLTALQGALGLGERAVSAGRHAEAAAHYRTALELAARGAPGMAERFALLAHLRLGQTLAELGDREQAVVHLAHVFETGRQLDDPVLRELAGQAGCNLHRALGALERWEEARALAETSLEFTRTLTSGTGRALAAAATYAHAFQALHDGHSAEALAGLAEVVRVGRDSGVDVGTRIALDAQLLIGHLHRQAGRLEEAVRAFKDALAAVRDGATVAHEAEFDAMAAMAQVNLGHALLALERGFEARKAYETALARGRASGLPSGRAAAANAALNLGSMLEGEEPDARRREWYESARALGRSSGTPLGNECATQAERAMERLARGDAPD